MSLNIPTHFTQQYSTNIQLLLQQMASKFEGTTMVGSHTGKQASPVDQIGAVEMQPVVSRFQPIGRVDAPFDRRWVSPADFDLPQLIDTFDKLRLITDPQSVYVQNAVAAAHRQYDDLIIAAFFAAAKTGVEGGTSTSFPSSQQVAVNHGAAGNVGASLAKLKEAKRILMANEVDLDKEEIFFAGTSKQHDNLLAETQIVSLDYNDRPVLVDGKITRVLGMTFKHSERLAVDGSSYRRMPVWCKSGMHLGKWGGEYKTDVSQRKDIAGLPFQVYLYMSAGATRTEEKKVVEIKCAE